MGRKSDSEWEQFGRTDPYYGVLSHAKYRKDNLTPEVVREFFATGEDHARFVLDTIRKHVDPAFQPAGALDFGCGVGRCLMPFGNVCGKLAGVDISPSMLAEARRNVDARGLKDVQLAPTIDALPAGSFDLIHSVIVFQHISPDQGIPLFTQLVSRLSDRGIGVIQLPYHRNVSRAVKILGSLRKKIGLVHTLANLAYGKPLREPLMEKNCYDLNQLFRILQAHACSNIHVEFQGRGDILSAILFFQKTPGWIAYEPFPEDETVRHDDKPDCEAA